jgi:hypothetical protein
MNTVSSAIAAQETPRGYQQYPQVPSQQYPVYQQYPQVPSQQYSVYQQYPQQPAPHFVPEQLQFVPEQLQYLQYPQYYQCPYYQYPHFTGGYNCEIQYVSPLIVSSSQPPQQQDASPQVPLTGQAVSM